MGINPNSKTCFCARFFFFFPRYLEEKSQSGYELSQYLSFCTLFTQSEAILAKSWIHFLDKNVFWYVLFIEKKHIHNILIFQTSLPNLTNFTPTLIQATEAFILGLLCYWVKEILFLQIPKAPFTLLYAILASYFWKILKKKYCSKGKFYHCKFRWISP